MGAVTGHVFPSFHAALAGKQVNLATDTLQVLLVASGSYSWNSTALTAATVADFLGGSSPGSPLTEVSTAGTGYARATLSNVTVQGVPLLTGQNAGFEGGLGHWGDRLVNSTVAASTAVARTGSYSMAVTATAAGNALASNGNGNSNAVPVFPGTMYTCSAWLRAATQSRGVQAGINWYTSGGAYISSSFPGPVNDTTSGWVQSAVSAAAPATAAFANPVVQIVSAAAGEVHYVDDATMYPGTAAPSATGYTTLTAANPTWSSATFTCSYGCVFDATVGGTDATNQLIGYWDFGIPQAVSAATPFVISLGSLNGVSQGIVQWASS